MKKIKARILTIIIFWITLIIAILLPRYTYSAKGNDFVNPSLDQPDANFSKGLTVNKGFVMTGNGYKRIFDKYVYSTWNNSVNRWDTFEVPYADRFGFDKKSIAGIFYSMRLGHGKNTWVNAKRPTVYDDEDKEQAWVSGWKSEGNVEILGYKSGDNRFPISLNDWGKYKVTMNDGEERTAADNYLYYNPTAMIYRWGALCFGHGNENGETDATKELRFLEWNENYQSPNAVDYDKGQELDSISDFAKLAYMIKLGADNKDVGTITETETKSYIRKAISTNWSKKNGYDLMQGVTTEEASWKGDTHNELMAENYANRIKNFLTYGMKCNTKKADVSVEYGAKYTYIGPYTIDFGCDILPTVTVTTTENKDIEAKLCVPKGNTTGEKFVELTNLTGNNETNRILL